MSPDRVFKALVASLAISTSMSLVGCGKGGGGDKIETGAAGQGGAPGTGSSGTAGTVGGASGEVPVVGAGGGGGAPQGAPGIGFGGNGIPPADGGGCAKLLDCCQHGDPTQSATCLMGYDMIVPFGDGFCSITFDTLAPRACPNLLGGAGGAGAGTGGAGGHGAPAGPGPRIVGTITPALKPQSLGVFQRGHLLLVGDSTSRRMAVYDTTTLAFVRMIDPNPLGPVGPYDGGIGVIDEPSGKMFTTVGNVNDARLAIVDVASGAVRLSDPGFSSLGFAADQERRAIFAPLANGGLEFINADTEAPGKILPLRSNGLTSGFGVNLKTHVVYVGYLQGKQLQMFSGVDYTSRVIPGQDGRALVVDPAHDKVVGGLATFDGIWVYDGPTDAVSVINVTWDGSPSLYSEATGRIYGTSEIDKNIAIYDGATNRVTLMPFPSSVPFVAVASTRHVFYVSERYTGALSEDTLVTTSLRVPNAAVRGGAFFSGAAADQTLGRVFVVNDANGDGVITVIDDAN